jgi:hypothetical protein
VALSAPAEPTEAMIEAARKELPDFIKRLRVEEALRAALRAAGPTPERTP